jgi:dTDP-4-dehydrorhamnose reductase
MMRTLVLGAGGMLGHKLIERLSAGGCEVIGTLRGSGEPYRSTRALAGARLRLGVSAEDIELVARALDETRAHAVINCIGIVKQREAAKDPASAIAVNALFPHLLAGLCRERGARLVHFSTDCVFSGRRGPYCESDPSDAEDLYGRTKFLGEVSAPGCLTLRSSIIGREIAGGAGLLEWFLAQRGRRIKGFAGALYSGLTTLAMADLVFDLLTRLPDIEGVWHVSGEPISKFELLQLINEVYDAGVTIERDNSFHCDRRLDSSRFRARTGFEPGSWRSMIEAMREDRTAYDAN